MSEIIFKVTGVVEGAQSGTVRSAGPSTVDAFASERAEGRVTTVRLGEFRSGQATHELSAKPGVDLVVIQLAGDGPELILHPETASELLRAQAGTATRQGSTDPRLVDVPAGLAWPAIDVSGAERGAARDAVVALFSVVREKALDRVKDAVGQGPADWLGDWLGGHVKQGLAGLVGRKIAERTDAKVSEGVYALSLHPTWPLKGQVALANIPAGSRSHLVLIHGTFVDTAATFAGLWGSSPAAMGKVFENFEGVYALDHATLGRSPIENALTLAEAFGRGARLELLTHSRGGLVAEVLVRAAAARGNVAEADSYLDEDGKPGPAHAALVALIRLLAERQIAIERVTRVACPVRGTLLASGRLDAYVSILRWALKLSGWPGDPLLEFVQDVAATRADPNILPGLEAMRPQSALVRWVNGGAPADTKLRVIAGDLRGDSLIAWAKMVLGDAFFWVDNDLVVQTRSMYGGVPRSEGCALYRFFSSGKASHFDYFSNTEIVFSIFHAVIEDSPREFRPIGPRSWAGESGSGERGRQVPVDPGEHPDKPVVFVLPGILGSHLRVGQDRVWLSARILAGLERIEYPRQSALPDGVLESSYADLIRFLARSHHVVSFSYDWRKPIEEEAKRLGEAVRIALDARMTSRKPVRFLAHSMGGLVVRTFMLECAALWERVRAHPGARFLMLGTPNAGSWVPMQVFTGDDDFGNLLAFAGSPFESRRGRELMAQMPGFVQLQAGLLGSDIATQLGWKKLADLDQRADSGLWHTFSGALGLDGWALPSDDVLTRAKRLRERLDGQMVDGRFAFADRTSLVVGCARQTPEGFKTTSARGLVYIDVVDGGDGRVTHESACLPGVPTWQVLEAHGKLADVSSAFEGYEEILNTGTTTKLSAYSGARRDGSTKQLVRVQSRPSRTLRVPSPPASVEVILSSKVEPTFSPKGAPELHVSVQTGDLRFVRQALLIGHYSSLKLTGAEAVIDGLLGGAMRKYLETRAYPSEPGDSATFPNHVRSRPFQLPRPEGVIVVGLGNESSLRAADLQKTVTKGVLNWVKTLVQSERGAPAELAIAATLIGSGGLGITTDVSARSIALGVQQANERLTAIGWPVVASLTLIELYKDRAQEAHRAVSMLTEIEGRHIKVDPRIAQGLGAKWGYFDGSYRGADYDLVSIENGSATAGTQASPSQSLDVLRYAVSTRRARTEVESHLVQGKLLEQIVKGGADGAPSNPQIGITLFRTLIPLTMVDLLGQSKRLVLELDPEVAGIPWEVLAGGDDAESTPWAISCKLVRKLRLQDYRPRPQDAREDDAILVIGEPLCDPGSYPRLPGALNEARTVVRVLDSTLAHAAHGGVFSVEHADAATIVHQLNARPYRIIHIAGHGEPGESRGVVLSAGAFLGPREIRGLPEVPELVFVNCCHLGTLGQDQAGVTADRPGFAASVAEALIRIGVKCVVAAGWAVDDAAASSFAETFYRTLLVRRRPFSDAVAEGRKAARATAPSSMTWAAYQCYGDPDWTFERDARDDFMTEAEAVAREVVASADELVARLDDLVVDFRYQSSEASSPGGLGRSALARGRERLQQLEQRYGAEYGTSGRVAQAFAEAYKYASVKEKAFAWYQRAVAAEDGQAYLAAIEQWANLRVRTAWDAVRQSEPVAALDIDAALAEVSQATDQLQRLCELQETSERWSLLGSAERRRALIERRGGRPFHDSLLRSMQHYLRASGPNSPTAPFYPAMNVLIAHLAFGPGAPFPPFLDSAGLERLIDDARASLHRAMQSDPDFFAAVGQVELDFYVALLHGTLSPELGAQLRARFRDEIYARVQSSHEWSSVWDSVQLVAGAWPDSAEVAGISSDLRGYAAQK